MIVLFNLALDGALEAHWPLVAAMVAVAVGRGAGAGRLLRGKTGAPAYRPFHWTKH